MLCYRWDFLVIVGMVVPTIPCILNFDEVNMVLYCMVWYQGDFVNIKQVKGTYHRVIVISHHIIFFITIPI